MYMSGTGGTSGASPRSLAPETVAIDPEFPTGTVDVALAPDGQPRFTIREHVAWDRIEADEASLARAALMGDWGRREPRSTTFRARRFLEVAAAPPAGVMYGQAKT